MLRGLTLVRLLKILSLVGFAWLCLQGDQWLPHNFQKDSVVILRLASDLEAHVGEVGKSYWNTAVFFSLFGGHVMPFIVLLGLVVLVVYLQPIETLPGMGMALFICAPAVILSMLRPQKETIMTLLVLAVYWVATRPKWPVWVQLPLIVLGYAVYAHLFRDYFYLIALVAAGIVTLLAIRIAPVQWGVMLGVFGALLAAPVEWLRALQEQRDRANTFRVAGEDGARTVINNPHYVNSTWDFIFNYGSAFVHLNVPALFSRHPKDLVMSVSTATYLYLIVRGYACKRPGSMILTTLFVAHALVLCLFEPDLGSYFRHLSSVFLYLLPGITVFEQDFRHWVAGARSRLKRRG
jgi:hypothetical protein